MTIPQKVHVVFGGGPLGRAVVAELLARGRRVRRVTRNSRPEHEPGVETLRADVTRPETATLCDGAEVLYHCVNPPYTQWQREFLPIQTGLIRCAELSGARLVFGDNLYAYGPVPTPLTEGLPALARGPNGSVRARIAAMLLEAHAAGRIRATIGRGSDFFGPHVLQSHAGERLFLSALRGKPAQLLANPDLPHTFTYIKDFARGLVILGENDRALGQVWHIPNAPTVTTRQFVERVYAQAGSTPAIRTLPRPFINALALAIPIMRALKEQLYQFEQPFTVDHTRFAEAFGDISTPMSVSIRETVEWFRGREKVPR